MFGHDLKPWEVFGYPFFFGLLAVGIARSFPSDLMTLFAVAANINCAFAGSFYLYHESCKFVDGQRGEPAPKPNTLTLEPVKQYPNLSNEKPTYNQNVMSLKIDPQKHCLGIILQQYEHGFDLDLTEDYWLSSIKSPSGKKSYKRWQGKNQEFRDFKKKWEGVIFGRENENKNSRFVIRNVEMLRQGARGQLPH